MSRYLVVFLVVFSCEMDLVVPPSSSKVVEGQKRFQEGNFKLAEASFSQAISNDSSDSEAYLGLLKSLKQTVRLGELITDIVDNDDSDKNLPRKILNKNLDLLTDYLSVLPQINSILNTFYVRDTAKKMDGRIPFEQVSIDFVVTAFIELFIFPQDIDSNQIINAEDTAKISVVLKEFRKDLNNVHVRIIKSVKLLAGDTIGFLEKIESINTFLRFSSMKAQQFSTALTVLTLKSNIFDDILAFKSDIDIIANTLSYYQFFDSLDNDNDGVIDEEILNGLDDDGDGYVDEDTKYPSSLATLPLI